MKWLAVCIGFGVALTVGVHLVAYGVMREGVQLVAALASGVCFAICGALVARGDEP